MLADARVHRVTTRARTSVHRMGRQVAQTRQAERRVGQSVAGGAAPPGRTPGRTGVTGGTAPPVVQRRPALHLWFFFSLCPCISPPHVGRRTRAPRASTRARANMSDAAWTEHAGQSMAEAREHPGRNNVVGAQRVGRIEQSLTHYRILQRSGPSSVSGCGHVASGGARDAGSRQRPAPRCRSLHLMARPRVARPRVALFAPRCGPRPRLCLQGMAPPRAAPAACGGLGRPLQRLAEQAMTAAPSACGGLGRPLQRLAEQAMTAAPAVY